MKLKYTLHYSCGKRSDKVSIPKNKASLQQDAVRGSQALSGLDERRALTHRILLYKYRPLLV